LSTNSKKFECADGRSKKTLEVFFNKAAMMDEKKQDRGTLYLVTKEMSKKKDLSSEQESGFVGLSAANV